MRKNANLIHIKSKELLLIEKKGMGSLPGGRIENKESDYLCLLRELKEKLPLIRMIYGKYYKTFYGIHPRKKDELESRVYFCLISGDLKTSEKISNAKYIKDFENYNVSDITKRVIESLKEIKYL